MTQIVRKDISGEALDLVIVKPGTLVQFGPLGIQVNADYAHLDDGGVPYVNINTSKMEPAYKYNAATSIGGEDKPFHAEPNAVDLGEGFTVWGPFEQVERAFARFPVVTTLDAARTAANVYAETLNQDWPSQCDMSIVAVHLNDAELFSDEGRGNTAPVVGTPQVHVVAPYDSDEPPAVFAHLGDAERYSATFSGEPGVTELVVCDKELAAEMIADRTDDDEDEDPDDLDVGQA